MSRFRLSERSSLRPPVRVCSFCLSRRVLCFFFQAEDGIRDYKVTGVQTCALPICLARVPLGNAEKERLEREEFEAKGFVSNLERLLLAVDNSPNGKFTSHIAGLIEIGRASCRERG